LKGQKPNYDFNSYRRQSQSRTRTVVSELLPLSKLPD
jgi:hypothetical protein